VGVVEAGSGGRAKIFAAGAWLGICRACPHEVQNNWPVNTAALQPGQCSASLLPQAAQKRALGGFSWAQLAQGMSNNGVLLDRA